MKIKYLIILLFFVIIPILLSLKYLSVNTKRNKVLAMDIIQSDDRSCNEVTSINPFILQKGDRVTCNFNFKFHLVPTRYIIYEDKYGNYQVNSDY